MIFLFRIGFLEITWVDLIDIGLVSVLLYQLYKLIKGSIAFNIFFGILSLYLIYLIVRAAQMELLAKILGQFMGVGVLAMIMSWMLLQAGYARRYAAMDRRGPGLVFPDTARPSAVDFVYFAVTIGTAFSVSDVQVTTARMRWHVLVHSVISFFYNAAVVGYALSLFAGR